MGCPIYRYWGTIGFSWYIQFVIYFSVNTLIRPKMDVKIYPTRLWLHSLYLPENHRPVSSELVLGRGLITCSIYSYSSGPIYWNWACMILVLLSYQIQLNALTRVVSYVSHCVLQDYSDGPGPVYPEYIVISLETLYGLMLLSIVFCMLKLSLNCVYFRIIRNYEESWYLEYMAIFMWALYKLCHILDRYHILIHISTA